MRRGGPLYHGMQTPVNRIILKFGHIYYARRGTKTPEYDTQFSTEAKDLNSGPLSSPAREPIKAGTWAMKQTREAIAQPLAERLCWQATCCRWLRTLLTRRRASGGSPGGPSLLTQEAA